MNALLFHRITNADRLCVGSLKEAEQLPSCVYKRLVHHLSSCLENNIFKELSFMYGERNISVCKIRE